MSNQLLRFSGVLFILIAAACAPQQTAQIIVVEPPAQQNAVIITPIPTLAPPTQTPAPTPSPTVDPEIAAQAACDSFLPQFLAAASSACIGKPGGFICNGGSAPQVQPEGPVSAALAQPGALVEVAAVQALHTTRLRGDGGGILWLRLAAPVSVRALLLGAVRVENMTPPEFPAWQSMLVQTGTEQSLCDIAPINALVLQSDLGVAARVVINGASLDLNGTMLVYTPSDSETVFTALSGQTRVLAASQIVTLVAGQRTVVPYAPGSFALPAGVPAEPQPLEIAVMHYLPVALFDRPIFLPQPGYVLTRGNVNMRSAPGTDAPVIVQVPAGEVLTVLGRNPENDWLHVMRAGGESGWMFAELLDLRTGQIVAVYESTPPPPQRYGDLGARASVQAPNGVVLRAAPDIAFEAIGSIPFGASVILLAQSPYSPWVKVDWNGSVGWVALLTLETQAVIAALPVDFNVPPPPEPTPRPGSGGNAFPDPDNP